ncbi:MAG: tetracycline resistance MFS efflux pump, partial [Chitinophagaceae bacterium]
GELQGALTSLMSATTIIGPVLMTNIFAYFTTPTNSIQFAGAPLLLAAFLTCISTILAYRTLHTKQIKQSIK